MGRRVSVSAFTTKTRWVLVVLMPVGGLLWPGCRSATMSRTGDDCAEEVRCPSLLGVPCINGADLGLSYFYCDRCGQRWYCAAWEGTDAPFNVWGHAGYACDCITEDYDIDTHNPACRDTY